MNSVSVAFTADNRNIKIGITNYGCLLPDPTIRNRLSICFASRTLEQDPDSNSDDNDNSVPEDEWKEMFNNLMRNRSMTKRAKLFVADLLPRIKAPDKIEDDSSEEHNLCEHVRGYCDVSFHALIFFSFKKA